MVLFGSSRKKRRDVFQAAIEQQSRGDPATRLGERHYGSAHQHGAGYSVFGRPLSWRGGSNDHPYGQPGFGFYSGENLSAGRPWRPEPATSMMSMGQGQGQGQVRVEDYGTKPLRTSLGPLGSPHQGNPAPGFRDGDGFDGWGAAWPHLAPSAYPDWLDLRYTVPDEQFPYSWDCGNFGDYGPATSPPPFGVGPLSSSGRQSPPQCATVGGFISPEHPTFDFVRPPGNEAISYPYTAWGPTGVVPDECQRVPTAFTDRTGDTFSASGGMNRVPRPPGSYERLRPPHLEQGRDGT